MSNETRRLLPLTYFWLKYTHNCLCILFSCVKYYNTNYLLESILLMTTKVMFLLPKCRSFPEEQVFPPKTIAATTTFA